MSEHTPTPWKYFQGHIVADDGTKYHRYIHVADPVNHPQRPSWADANAEHIVRCVNSFDELVAALSTVREALFNLAPLYRGWKHFGTYEPGPDCPCSICVIDEVLAKAKGAAS